MFMKRAYLVGILLIFIGLQKNCYSQSGNYFMTQYSPTLESIDNTNFDIVQDNYGVINIANRAGLLRFDGRTWEHTSTPASIFSLDFDSLSNTVYCAGYNGFGKFELNKKNILQYVSLADSSDQVGPVYQLLLNDNTLFGLGEDLIYAFDLEAKKLTKIKSQYSGDMYKLFEVENELYVSTENSGLKLIFNGALADPKIDNSLILDIEFIESGKDGRAPLVGTTDNQLYVLKGGEAELLKIKDDDNYLAQSGFVDAVWVNRDLIAIATFKGGVIFVNYKTKAIEQIINYQSGLPDNEVFALSKDSNEGLWVVHSNGFTRVSPQLPLSNFSYYEGLEGKILSVVNHKNNLYVGTSLGLFNLKKVNLYDEIDYLQRKTVQVDVPATSTQEAVPEKRGLLGLFKKKKNQTKITSSTPTVVSKTVYTSKTRKQLRSTSYRFEKVKGINSRVTHLASNENAIYASSLDGLFKITGENSVMLSSESTGFFTLAEKSRLLVSATTEGQIQTFSLLQGNREINLFDDYRDNIQYIFEGDKNQIWFTSDDEVFNVSIENFEIYETQNYPITNSYFCSTYGSFVDSQPLFINQSGNLSIDAKNKLVNTSADLPARYILGSNSAVWILKNDQWSLLGTKVKEKKNLLNVFKNLNYISQDDDSNYWVVTEKNELVKIGNKNASISETYDLYLKHIISNDSILSVDQKLKFVQSKNTLSFQFSQPEFSGILELKYQYQLEGLNKEWSQWSDNYNKLNFNYLPEGSYKLKVRSKDVLGVVKEIKPIEFRIVPPYWKRPWFYALEFTLLALLLMGSVRLKDLGFKYRLASRLLALITLIIIIEFIQTIAENKFADESSPVFDFIIQVSIAIIVLPVESLIRKYLFREKDVQIFDFVKLKNKGSK